MQQDNCIRMQALRSNGGNGGDAKARQDEASADGAAELMLWGEGSRRRCYRRRPLASNANAAPGSMSTLIGAPVASRAWPFCWMVTLLSPSLPAA